MTRSLTLAVAAMRPGLDVRVSFLDHAGPRPGEVLFAISAQGYRSAVVVPLLLTPAYHSRIDLPAVLTAADAGGLRLDVAVTDVLGPVDGVTHPLLLAGLRQRLASAVSSYDGVVLAAAGTRDDTARSTVDVAAYELGRALGVPCRAAFASGSRITGAVAVEALRASGLERVAVAAYFLACGRLYDTVTASALSAGALAPVAEPLGNAVDLARLVLDRVVAVTGPGARRLTCVGRPFSP
jgi:sirohydrochlorin ferrochelatase